MIAYDNLPPGFSFPSPQMLSYFKNTEIKDVCIRYNSIIGGAVSKKQLVKMTENCLLSALKIFEAKGFVYSYLDSKSSKHFFKITEPNTEIVNDIDVDDEENFNDNELLFEASVHVKYGSLIRSAVSRDLSFDLDVDDVRNLLSQTHCYYTGVKFDKNNPDHVRTIERVIQTEGYVKGNVVATTLYANKLKNTLLECPNALFESVEKMKHFVDMVYITSSKSNDVFSELLINKLN